MKYIFLLAVLQALPLWAQKIAGVQVFNPQTNDETPVILMGGGSAQKLIISFDDLSGQNTTYRYSIQHCDRNWQPDDLFFTQYASGTQNPVIEDFRYSFNTLQRYTHYEFTFPNVNLAPKVSGNFLLTVFADAPGKPLFTRKIYVVDAGKAQLSLRPERALTSDMGGKNQRVQALASVLDPAVMQNTNALSLKIMQNNNDHVTLAGLRPSSVSGNQLFYQQPTIAFPGNNEFYYFDNKNINYGFDMVAGGEIIDNKNFTYLHPATVFPLDYQYMPDVNGAFYFRRNDLGVERDPKVEADYSYVHFYLNSLPVDRKIHVLGGFNAYQPSKESTMVYDADHQQYVAKIYLKQGFYNYTFAIEREDGTLDFGKINGNFWQTSNLYQAFLYDRPFGYSYDALIGYGEYRPPVQ